MTPQTAEAAPSRSVLYAHLAAALLGLDEYSMECELDAQLARDNLHGKARFPYAGIVRAAWWTRARLLFPEKARA